MAKISDLAELETIYGAPAKASIIKVVDHVTPLYEKWINASRLCILSTVGPEGTDGSPRGDDGPVVRIATPKQILMPDWRGNNRTDSLRNIVADERVSLMFFVQGSDNVIRVNGTAEVHCGPEFCDTFLQRGRTPRSVIVINVAEVYSQCARALMRAGTWSGEDHSADLPTIGDLLAEAETGFDGESYDATWLGRAKTTMW